MSEPTPEENSGEIPPENPSPPDSKPPDPKPADPKPPEPSKPADANAPRPASAPSVFSQGLSYAQISARVPEKIVRGVFATASLVINGSHEIAIDFLLRLVPPPMLAARVIMPFGLLPSVVQALHENIENYRSRFAAPAPPPAPPPGFVPPKIHELYEEMKQPEDVMAGAYANKLMITHSPGEFCFDFIFDLFPRPVVTSRIYMSAQQAPVLLETLKRIWGQIQQQHQQQAVPPPSTLPPESPGAPPESPPASSPAPPTD